MSTKKMNVKKVHPRAAGRPIKSWCNTLYAVVEWIPAAMCVQFAHWTFSLERLFPFRALAGGKA